LADCHEGNERGFLIREKEGEGKGKLSRRGKHVSSAASLRKKVLEQICLQGGQGEISSLREVPSAKAAR